MIEPSDAEMPKVTKTASVRTFPEERRSLVSQRNSPRCSLRDNQIVIDVFGLVLNALRLGVALAEALLRH